MCCFPPWETLGRQEDPGMLLSSLLNGWIGSARNALWLLWRLFPLVSGPTVILLGAELEEVLLNNCNSACLIFFIGHWYNQIILCKWLCYRNRAHNKKMRLCFHERMDLGYKSCSGSWESTLSPWAPVILSFLVVVWGFNELFCVECQTFSYS